MNALNNPYFLKRLLMTLTGVLVCSFSVGMFKLAAFGVDPFQCFAQGSHLPFADRVQYGTYYLGISLVMLVAAAIAGHLGGKLVFAGRGR